MIKEEFIKAFERTDLSTTEKVVLLGIQSGLSKKELCEVLHITPQAYYKFLKACKPVVDSQPVVDTSNQIDTNTPRNIQFTEVKVMDKKEEFDKYFPKF